MLRSIRPTRNSDTGFRVRQPDVARPIKLAVQARWPHPLPMRVFRQANVHDPDTDSGSGSGEGAEPGDGSIRWRMPSIGIETQSGR